MAYFDSTATTAKNLYFAYGGNQVIGVTSINGVQPGGSAPDIDVTDLQSTVRQFLIGLVDPGQASCSVLVDMADPAYQALVTANETGTSAELRLVVGSAAAGTAVTTGAGFQTYSTGGTNTNWTAAAGKVTVSTAGMSALPGVKAGHYIGIGAVNSQNYTRITSVTPVSGGLELAHAGNALVPGNNPITLWKPAVEIRRQARVMELTQDYQIDQGIVLNLTFRNTGTATFTVGNPNITI